MSYSPFGGRRLSSPPAPKQLRSEVWLQRLRVRDLLSYFQLRSTPENRALMRAIQWLPRTPIVRVQGIYAIVDTANQEMRVGFSRDVWRRCYVEHHGKLRRGNHPCLLVQNDCTGIDGDRWRVLLLESVADGSRLRVRERWWRAHVPNELEREEHWARYDVGVRDRRPSY
jgi:hypothetical protein